MKHIYFTIMLLFCTVSFSVQAESDSLRINRLEQTLKNEIKSRELLEKKMANQEKVINSQKNLISSLQTQVKENAKSIQRTSKQLGLKITSNTKALNQKAESSELKHQSLWGGIVAIVLAIVAAIVYFALHKRIKKGDANVDELRENASINNEALKQRIESLNEEIVKQFESEIAEIQKLTTSIGTISSTTQTNDEKPDHSLIKTLADRITFMEMTLYKMDPNVRGHKQLSKSITQMKDNLLANGYELVDMLGKPYDGGMKVTANFIEDEELETGKQIITGIIKPQINYKGVMIQAAQITVSQNL